MKSKFPVDAKVQDKITNKKGVVTATCETSEKLLSGQALVRWDGEQEPQMAQTFFLRPLEEDKNWPVGWGFLYE